MRPKVGLRVLRDVVTETDNHDPRRPFNSSSSASNSSILPVGRVTKVTDEHIEVKWSKDDKPKRCPVKDDGTFGLRVLDDPDEKGTDKRCWICTTGQIKGFAWICQSCPRCVLCTRCYMTNGHPQMGHWFLRCSGEFPQGDPMPVRNNLHRKKVINDDATTTDVLLDHLPILSLCQETGANAPHHSPSATPAIVTADLLGLEVISSSSYTAAIDLPMAAANAAPKVASAMNNSNFLRPSLPPRPGSFPRSPSATEVPAGTPNDEVDGVSSGGESSDSPSGSTTPLPFRSNLGISATSAAAATAAAILTQTAAAEEALTCPVCYEHYQLDGSAHAGNRHKNQQNKAPLVLTSCGHTLCSSCATQLHARQIEGAISCPVCRKETQVNSVDALNRNFSLLDIMETRKTQLQLLLQPDNSGTCLPGGLPRAASSSCLLDSPSSEHGYPLPPDTSSTQAGASAAALSSVVPALVAQLAAATSGPKAFKGLCHSHGRNLSLWCAVCCEILCMGCVDAHSGHEKLTAEELPACLEERMAILAPQIAGGVDNLNETTTRLLTTVDKMIRELKDVKHHSRDETKEAGDRKTVIEEYRKGLSSLDLEEMISAWHRADSLVVEIRAKIFQTEQLKKELDKDLLAWLRKKPKFLGSRNDPNRRRSPSRGRPNSDHSRQRSAPSSPAVFGFSGPNFGHTSRRKTSKPGPPGGAIGPHMDQSTPPPALKSAASGSSTQKSPGDRNKSSTTKIFGKFFIGSPKNF